jgi:hypothetical protein
MKTVNLATSFVLAGAIAFASAASATDYPYGFFTASKDDNSVATVDSFNPVKTVTKTKSDDDSAVDSFNSEKTITKTRTDDHSATDSFNKDLTILKKQSDDHSIADSYNKDLTIKKSDDHSIADSFNSDDDTKIDTRYTYDYTSKYNVAKPELNSIKYQSQDAGHEGSAYANGSADGHDVSTTGSTNYLEVGNDTSSAFLSPTFVNNNVPVNTVVAGDNLGNILTSTKVAGRDQDVNRGIMNSDIGNTMSLVSGDVSQTSLSGVDQSGDSSNSIADPMSVSLSQ